MTAARPLPIHPPSLLALLEAVEGLPDETVVRLIDRWYPEAGAFLREQPGVIDRALAGPCADCTEPLCVRCELPGDLAIDMSNAHAEARRRAWPTLEEGVPM